uniref:Uncharacterized protein n=1 Tax=Picea sitchensis TaxID=3332 RepID=A0A6B9XRG2_PICSI|nr:hypothetical protein Q903MT_gene5776 [Picea sitchensis]
MQLEDMDLELNIYIMQRYVRKSLLDLYVSLMLVLKLLPLVLLMDRLSHLHSYTSPPHSTCTQINLTQGYQRAKRDNPIR